MAYATRPTTRTAATAMTRQPPDPAAARASGRRRAGTGGRAGLVPAEAGGRAGQAASGRVGAGTGGMSAVSAARSANVRAASARPARVPSSSLVSRPCTNASFSVSITCPRSAWPARNRPLPAVAGSSGPVGTGTSPYNYLGRA